MAHSEWDWMQRALQLAERGRGYVEPNPLVGAVIVRDGRVVGEGWHQRFGDAHAEINALKAAGDAASGATLYVTLEPCCHQGKTSPCTEAVAQAGIRRVVAAMSDPFSAVSGKGFATLQAAGVDVENHCGETQARRLNAPYLKLIQTGRPYVHAKWAMTLDGKIATRSGDSRWISNEEARSWVHSLRGRMDAIIVGVGTALADDPRLTARPAGPRTATRIVLDGRGRLRSDSVLVRTARETPVIVASTGQLPRDRQTELKSLGCEVLDLTADGGKCSIPELLDELGKRRMTNVLVEGGGAALGSFFDARSVDEVHVFLAPKIIGGSAALSPVAGLGIDRIAVALQVSEWSSEMVGDNVLIHGQIMHSDEGGRGKS